MQSILKHKNYFVVIIYFVYLFSIRILLEIILKDWLNQYISKDLLGSTIWSLIKLVLWCLPIFIYLVYKRTDFKSYFRAKYSLKFNFIKLALFLVVWVFLIFFQYGFQYEFDTTIYVFLHDALFTAFIEEFVFRGFLLDKLSKSLNFNVANLIQSILFSVNHLPFLYLLGMFGNTTGLLVALIFYVFFGFMNGYITKKSKSLVPTTVLHGVNNLVLGWVGGW